jgi:hypothetical protein
MRVGITGHQSLPRRSVPAIERMLQQLLAKQPVPLTCVTSLAQGADQMCAAIALRRGSSLHVVVPCARYEESFTTAAALRRFNTLLAESASVETLSFPHPSEEAFLAAGRRVVDLSDLLAAVWDGKPARGKGGTADIVAYARARHVVIEVVWPAGAER